MGLLLTIFAIDDFSEHVISPFAPQRVTLHGRLALLFTFDMRGLSP